MVDNYEFWDPEKETHKEFKQRTKGKGMRGGVGKKKNAEVPEGGLSKIREIEDWPRITSAGKVVKKATGITSVKISRITGG